MKQYGQFMRCKYRRGPWMFKHAYVTKASKCRWIDNIVHYFTHFTHLLRTIRVLLKHWGLLMFSSLLRVKNDQKSKYNSEKRARDLCCCIACGHTFLLHISKLAAAMVSNEYLELWYPGTGSKTGTGSSNSLYFPSINNDVFGRRKCLNRGVASLLRRVRRGSGVASEKFTTGQRRRHDKHTTTNDQLPTAPDTDEHDERAKRQSSRNWTTSSCSLSPDPRPSGHWQ